jgi:hypothetical protein
MQFSFNGNFYGNGHTIRNLVLPGGSIHLIGLFGFIENALITNLQVELGENVISVTNSSGQLIGIIAGASRNSTIRNCGVYSQYVLMINGSNNQELKVAGITNTVTGSTSSIVENCYVSMNITTTNDGIHTGVYGITDFSMIIENCYYVGNITATGRNIYLHGINRGGDAGYFVRSSYSAGTIINNATQSGFSSASGISNAGPISNNATLMSTINSSHNIARIQRSNQSALNTSPPNTNNYAFSGMRLNNNTVTSSDPNGQHGLDKTAAQLKMQSTYEIGLGWDFDNVWEMGPAEYPFPILMWQNGVVKLPPGFTVIQD